MNFSQALDLAFIASVVLFTWIIVNGLTQSAIACWNSTARKPQAPVKPLAYHYACPLTCELPQVSTEATVAALEVEEVEESPQPLPVPCKAPETGKKSTLAQRVKVRCSQVFGYEIKTPNDAKRAIINKSNVSFMGAVNLERKGAEFWQAVDSELDRIEAERKAKRAA